MSHLLKRVFFVLFTLFMLVALWVYFLVQSEQAVRDGSLNLPNLSNPVEVLYDDWGVPHIYADSTEDALRALGYLHAQDRLFQMDLLRRVGSGTLSELFGEAMLDTDQLFRTLGINRYAAQLATRMREQPELPQNKLMSAYQAGINHYIATRAKPLEYEILRTEVKPFTLEDLGHTLGYMAYSFAGAFKTDPLYHWIGQELGDQYLQDLAPFYLEGAFTTQDSRGPLTASDSKPAPLVAMNPALLSISQQVLQINESMFPAGHFIGSNSWVLAPSRTDSGKPILANDPHIGIAVPAVWYEAHIVSPDYEVYGHYLAGIPFAVLGNTRHHAWGLTMFENDDIDFYQEQSNPKNPQQIKNRDQWENLKSRQETILVKGAEPVTITVRESRHGPIISDLAKPAIKLENNTNPVSIFWTFTDANNDTVDALYRVNRARNMQQFEAAVADIWAPGLNINYADTEGNIGIWATGRLPNRAPGVHSMNILDGASGEQDIRGYLDFSHNPRRVNPDNGIIFSANHPYSRDGEPMIPGYYASADRAERLNQLLSPENNGDRRGWTLEEMKAIQLDTEGALNDHFRQRLLASLTEPQQGVAQDALNALSNWDKRYPLDSIGATIFERAYYFALQQTFSDELGDRQPIFIKTFMADNSFQQILANESSPWWDRRETAHRESRDQILAAAWQLAIASLQSQFGDDTSSWQWGKVHSIEHPHPLGKVKPLNKLFNVGPFPIDSSKRSLSKMAYTYAENQYRVSSNPSTRRIIPLANVEQAQGINPVGQSGNPFDTHFDDQARLYNQGRYRSQLMNRQQIEQVTSGRLELIP
ncbi:penicillin acylase family protein [Aestuariirhabdus sp. Z084]|uniref:penicillin acylase family protein n=1 Tax=Aestuariirhabdus haliotis TaxID=2918751 RepID=UPI00201B390C|nr:penicillin acylase family protein [Aestuariirhabdus haliotis]MCL6417419.1 penicillin acylase family protein [Aestuariirhabdus haliotis]MCL6421363.1 penicillin acylase family protein [Aestuariirhabdus haliotis]